MIIENKDAIIIWKDELMISASRDGWDDCKQRRNFRWTSEERTLYEVSSEISSLIRDGKSVLIVIHQNLYVHFLDHLISTFCEMNICNVRKRLLEGIDWTNFDNNITELFGANIVYSIYDENNPSMIPLNIIAEKGLGYLCFMDGKNSIITEMEQYVDSDSVT